MPIHQTVDNSLLNPRTPQKNKGKKPQVHLNVLKRESDFRERQGKRERERERERGSSCTLKYIHPNNL